MDMLLPFLPLCRGPSLAVHTHAGEPPRHVRAHPAAIPPSLTRHQPQSLGHSSAAREENRHRRATPLSLHPVTPPSYLISLTRQTYTTQHRRCMQFRPNTMVTILSTAKSHRTRHLTTTTTTTIPLRTRNTTSIQATPHMHTNTPIPSTAIIASIPIIPHTLNMLLTTTVSKWVRHLAAPNRNTVASAP